MLTGGAVGKKDIEQLPVSHLIPYEGQPFRPYPIEKLRELAEDIKENGILSPVIVRPYVGRYQILAGHNRVNAAKLIGMDIVPCIVKDVDDDTARLIMVNTNLNQRDELLPSEKAFAYKIQLEAMKCQGKRNDLGTNAAQVTDADNLGTNVAQVTDANSFGTNVAQVSDANNFGTNVAQVRSRDVVAQASGESRETVRCYIRLTRLIKPLLDLTDQKEIPFRGAVELSFLKENEQTLLYEYVSALRKKIDLDKAKLLRMHSKDGTFGYKALDEVFGKQPAEEKPAKKKKIQISYQRLERYIQPDASAKEAEEYILEALEFYEKHKG